MTSANTETAQEIKARGGFYTPPMVAGFIARWAIRSGADRVLEPACGDGSFITAAIERLADLGKPTPIGLVGIERSPAEAAKARLLAPASDIRTASFFDIDLSDLEGPFDAVIGNPPFIRYQGFVGEDRKKGLARATAQGVRLTRLASSWAHFVVHATSFLSDTGRLGLVLPAELLVTDYAQAVRAHLLARFTSVIVVAFDRPVFEDAQVDAVVLLASNDTDQGIQVIRVADANALDTVSLPPQSAPTRHEGRWITSLDSMADSIYREVLNSGLCARLSTIATVDIGVVTGANRYFVLLLDEAVRLGISSEYLVPIVERPRDVPGLRVAEDEAKFLLLLPPSEIRQRSIRAYLDTGKSLGIDQRYKCRVRRFWYSVPLPKKRPDAFLPYMTGDAPRLIVNGGGAWSTNLLHGVALREDAPDVRAVSAAMLSSVTMLSAEVEGRSYGGGVLKLETRESERLLVPSLSNAVERTLVRLQPEMDRLVRVGALDMATRIVDAVLGVDAEPLVQARLVFRMRRLSRGSKRPS
jgi:adenine-specific DNA methylase